MLVQSRRGAGAIFLAVVLGMLPLWRMPAALAASHVAAPSPKTLAVTRAVFPSIARIQGGGASNKTADQASGLQGTGFTSLHRQHGYLQIAGWPAPAVRGSRGNRYLSLQYLASVFDAPASAAAAEADARAALWQSGAPSQVTGITGSTFVVNERDGHQSVYVLLVHGVVEAELRLRYDRSLDNPAVLAGLASFRRLTHAASQRINAYMPVESAPAIAAPAPPFVAPWGTGPIVKSPSLITPTTADTGDPGPGEFAGAQAPIAHRVIPAAHLVPADPLSRYDRTATVNPNGGWYTSVALYPDIPSAHAVWLALHRANARQRGLRADRRDFTLQRDILVDERAAWTRTGETVAVLRVDNLLVVMTSYGQSHANIGLMLDRLLNRVPTWLHTDSTQIVDAAGDPVRLAYLNWYGAESPDFVVGGLQYQSYRAILQRTLDDGYNGIRLPFSQQLVDTNPVVTDHLQANPDLVGLHALDIMDRIISYAGALGLSVILDNHRSEAGWSSQLGGLWYTPQYSDATFISDWHSLAAHFAVNNVVIGADLRNEPHGAATWGTDVPTTDWRLAAERAGNAVVEANPHLLVIVEGVQYVAGSAGYWWGGNLMGVTAAPVELKGPDGSPVLGQLVYSAHDYGPDNCHDGCPWFNASTTYQSLSAVWKQYWGYIMDPTATYHAPVWVGEFGTCNTTLACVQSDLPGTQGQWFGSLVRYIHDNNMSWAYWSLNGTQSSGDTRQYGANDFYGYLGQDWITPIAWIDHELQSIQTPSGPSASAGS